MFDYYDTAYFIITFILIFVVFYIIITNFGYSITFKTSDNIIEKKINNIQSEIINMNSKINNSTTEEKILDDFDNSPTNYNKNEDEESILSIKDELLSYKKILKQKNTHINKLKQKNKKIIAEQEDDDDEDDDVNFVVNKNNNDNFSQNGPKKTVMFDPIANYDNAKILDPLVDPLQRTSADQIPNPNIAMQLNFPSQGVLDKYHRIGLLTAIEPSTETNNFTDSSNNIVKRKAQVPIVSEENERSYNGVWLSEKGKIEGFGNMSSEENNILELMGKRRYHGVYRYFTSISMGNKIIKVMINSKNGRELYSGDIVFIKELKKSFRVEIDDMDMIEYNPYMI
jgi:hypothetical protein